MAQHCGGNYGECVVEFENTAEKCRGLASCYVPRSEDLLHINLPSVGPNFSSMANMKLDKGEISSHGV
jgi:hypothetical protein